MKYAIGFKRSNENVYILHCSDFIWYISHFGKLYYQHLGESGTENV